jgi:prophage regulatory protein
MTLTSPAALLASQGERSNPPAPPPAPEPGAQDAPRPHMLEPLLPIGQVVELTSLSKTTVYRMVDEGRFPAPLKIGKARVAWRASAIARWMSEQVRAA